MFHGSAGTASVPSVIDAPRPLLSRAAQRQPFLTTLTEAERAAFGAAGRTSWGAGEAPLHPAGLDVRAGVHTGEIELRGDEVAGIGMHIAARVSAKAGAGEVLVSRTVQDLVVGSGYAFASRGMHDLKGVPDAWALPRARSVRREAPESRAHRRGGRIAIVRLTVVGEDVPARIWIESVTRRRLSLRSARAARGPSV